MADLVRTLVIAGLISGTQPITIMGLLIMRTTSASGPRNSWLFLLGALTVETGLLITANLVVGGRVERSSAPGTGLLVLRVLVGVALVVAGIRLRRGRRSGADEPAMPRSFERLRDLSGRGAFVAGVLFADYVGPVVASMAIATSTVAFGGRLAATALYTALATGLPAALLLVSVHSARAGDDLDRATHWTIRHRRDLAAWLALAAGTLLVVDGVIGWYVVDR